ncbi:MAG: ATP phosphoribosyltransferase [Candidatus Aminicenantes bacterium]|nr:ATP phosphoribosyltransferase [Candidatus Aminicenantes bacterium]
MAEKSSSAKTRRAAAAGRSRRPLKLIIPKGRLHGAVVDLLNDCGYGIETDERVYVPRVADPEIEAKLLKPQNIPRLIELGSHDAGFCGHDWVVETGADVVEVLDLGLDPVSIVAAAPPAFRKKKRGPVVVASEYERLARRFLKERYRRFIFLRTYGATEVFPPDDADIIIDNASSGRTLKGHGLKVIAALLDSSTRFLANRGALRDRRKREKIEQMKILFRAVLDARERVMLEMNVGAERLDAIVSVLPCMRAPTVAPLFGGLGYAVKVAIRKREAAALIMRLKRMGAQDILETAFRKVVV